MFYDSYLTKEEKVLLNENYALIINNIDNGNAYKIVNILENNNCKFINDLIINYIEIFLQKPSVIETKLNFLKNELGELYMSIIENNLNLLVD